MPGGAPPKKKKKKVQKEAAGGDKGSGGGQERLEGEEQTGRRKRQMLSFLPHKCPPPPDPFLLDPPPGQFLCMRGVDAEAGMHHHHLSSQCQKTPLLRSRGSILGSPRGPSADRAWVGASTPSQEMNRCGLQVGCAFLCFLCPVAAKASPWRTKVDQTTSLAKGRTQEGRESGRTWVVGEMPFPTGVAFHSKLLNEAAEE